MEAQQTYTQPLAIGDANVWLRTEEDEWSRVAATNVTVQPEGVVTLTSEGTRMCVPLWAVLTIESAAPEEGQRATVADLLARGVIAAPSPSGAEEGGDDLAARMVQAVNAFKNHAPVRGGLLPSCRCHAEHPSAGEPTPSDSKSDQTLGDAEDATSAGARKPGGQA